jgi:hypothetical protein
MDMIIVNAARYNKKGEFSQKANSSNKSEI